MQNENAHGFLIAAVGASRRSAPKFLRFWWIAQKRSSVNGQDDWWPATGSCDKIRTAMIERIIYRCPRCGAYDWLRQGRCRRCAAAVSVRDRTALTVNGTTAPIGVWYDRIRAITPAPDSAGVLLNAHGVCCFRERFYRWGRLADGLHTGFYRRSPVDHGCLTLKKDALVFAGLRRVFQIPFSRLTGVTIESNVVIVGVARRAPLFFRFAGGVGKCWEDALRSALDDHCRPAVISAYYPRVRTADGDEPIRRTDPLPAPSPSMAADGGNPVAFALLGPVVRRLIYPMLPVTVHGRHHVPAAGGAVIVSNHGSFLDAILLGAALLRLIRFMAKDSEFHQPLLAVVLRQLRAFPVRRYAVDAQAVRNARRIVFGGHLLGLFPEGERSWDGRLLPLRHGALRLLLTLGAPIVPTGISGAYPVMPRWTHRPRTHPVSIRFGAPVHLPPLPPGCHTPAVIAALERLLRRRITALLDAQ